MKVSQFYNKNQFLKKEGNEIILQSYDSEVLSYNIKNNILKFGKNWDYSNTTLKHICLFISDFVNNAEIKQVNFEANKKRYLQKMIDKKYILLDNTLQSI